MERLQKVMAKAGIGSRRRCEELISAGEVKVNGKVISAPGCKVDTNCDAITVSGSKLPRFEKKHYYVLYKPRGYVCTVQDEKGRKNVLEWLSGVKERVYPVGRLDYSSEGVLLLTNDGDLTYALTHPKYRVPKTYLVKVAGHPTENKLNHLAKGVPLPDGLTAPVKVKLLEVAEEKSLLEITLFEGRNRQLRRMCEYIGHPVVRLTRTKVANIRLDGLRPGQYRPLTEKELKDLQKVVANVVRSEK